MSFGSCRLWFGEGTRHCSVEGDSATPLQMISWCLDSAPASTRERRYCSEREQNTITSNFIRRHELSTSLFDSVSLSGPKPSRFLQTESVWQTVLMLSFSACGTQPSTLERGRVWAHRPASPENTEEGLDREHTFLLASTSICSMRFISRLHRAPADRVSPPLAGRPGHPPNRRPGQDISAHCRGFLAIEDPALPQLNSTSLGLSFKV